MSVIRHEITGHRAGARSATTPIGHNRGPPLEEWIELQRIVDLKEAARLSGMSIDTIKRRHSDKIIDLSPRRRGMRVRDALMLKEEESV
jgi:hypothetical protein